ncbi:MAG: PQQ-binding-like beta-propeller repeat protein [Verrucomicrobiota bacterium]
MHTGRFRFLSIALLGLSTVLISHAADWPKYRGPGEDAQSTEKLGSLSPSVLWKADVGIGNSSFVIADGRAFTMGNDGENKTSVFCFEAATGKVLWEQGFPSDSTKGDFPGGKTPFHGGPNSTPLIDGDYLYTVSRFGRVDCWKLASGENVWSFDWGKKWPLDRKQLPTWGYSSSPVIDGDRLFIEPGAPGASMVCLDRNTGKILWQSGDDRAAYSTPLVAEIDGKNTLLAFNRFGLVGFDPENGQSRWDFEWETQYGVNSASVLLCGDDRIFLSSGYGKGAAMVQVKDGKVEELWTTKRMKNKHTVSVFIDEHIYGFSEAELTCINADTGEVKWVERGYGRGALVVADEKMIVQSETPAHLVIGEFSPDGFTEVWKSERQFDEHSWTMPILSNGLIFTRNVSGKIVVFDAR